MSAQELYYRTIDFLRLRSRAYKLSFPDPKNNEVLKDLAKYCRANETCFNADPRKHAIAEGRREVWLRIQQHLNLQPDELYAIYNGQSTLLRPTQTQKISGE
jgi:hypothetical protein